VKWFIAHLSTMTPLGAYLWLTGILLLCGLGLPVPEDISLIAAGYFSWKGVLEVKTALAVCFAAVLAGDAMAFGLGRFFGRRVLASQLAHRYFTPRRQRRVRAYFRKFGSKVVVVGRFTPGFRFTIFFTAGTLHLRPSVFFIYDFTAAAISVPVLVLAANYFGAQIDRVVSYARHTEHGILVAVAIGAAVLVIKGMRRRRHKQLAAQIAAATESTTDTGTTAASAAPPRELPSAAPPRSGA
jgi:membrane protein DedA with SNARE-associated domain